MCVGGERDQTTTTTTTGPHPKAAAEGWDVAGGTGLGAVAARAVDNPHIPRDTPCHRTLLLPEPLLCVQSWCETRGHHKAFCSNRDQSQLRALALPINSASGEGLN